MQVNAREKRIIVNNYKLMLIKVGEKHCFLLRSMKMGATERLRFRLV